MKLTSLINNTLNRLGFGVHRYSPAKPLLGGPPKRFKNIVKDCRKYTLTTNHRLAAMVDSLRYVESTQIAGDIVDCGVWRVGNVMASAHSLMQLENNTRDLYLLKLGSIEFDGNQPPTCKA